MTRLAPKDQDLPKWTWDEAERSRSKRGWVCQVCIVRMSSDQLTCSGCGRPRPRVGTPKPAPPKPKGVREPKPETPRLHIRIELSGFMELLLEGDRAKEMRGVLTAGHNANDVIEALDPYSSGIEIKQEIRILEDPFGNKYQSWAVSEERGTFKSSVEADTLGPFTYIMDGSGKPKSVDWRQVQ